MSEHELDNGGTATIVQTDTAPPRLARMPQWNVLLHDDDVNFESDVVEAILELTSLRFEDAVVRMVEAHKSGIALLLSTHQEHAELLQEQFESKRLTVTIEPAK